MKTMLRKAFTSLAVANAVALGFTSAARAVDPTVAFDSIQATAQTNFNGSVVVAHYTAWQKGSYNELQATITVGGQVCTGVVDTASQTVTFVVPGNVAAASNVYAGAILVKGVGTSESETKDFVAYRGNKYLYQGHLDAVATNGWFATSATGATLNEQDGAWGTPKPTAADDKIVIAEKDDGTAYTFAPTNPQNGQVAVIDMDVTFDGTLDEIAEDLSNAQAAIRIVECAGDVCRFATIVNGAWQTNTTMEAVVGQRYPVRVTFDYRAIPATVTYAVKKGNVYTTIATGPLRSSRSSLADVSFYGDGKLTQMVGSNCVDSVDASLVAAGGNKYANVDAAIAAGKTDMTLLWNTSWTPSGKGEWRIAGGSYKLYVDPAEGLLVKYEDGVYTVITDYYEAMNLLFGADGVTTNKFTFFTNAVASTEAGVTNLYLLRDVNLGAAAVAVAKDFAVNGDTNILSGAGFTVANGKTVTVRSGCIGIPHAERIVLETGRFNAAATNSWTEHLPTDYTFAEMALPVREGYKWQLIKKEQAPGDGEKLLPVTDANGESVSIVLSNSWAQAVTKTDVPAEQSVALSEIQGNGLTFLENAILGLTNNVGKAVAGNIPVIAPVQSTETNKIKFELKNVKVATYSDRTVKYCVFKSSNPGGKDGGASEKVDYNEKVLVDLPGSGVMYYLIEVDIGTIK